MIASVSSAASDSLLLSEISKNFRSMPSCSGRVTNLQPPPADSSRIPPGGEFVRSARRSRAAATRSAGISSISARSLTDTGFPEANRTASSSGRIASSLASVMIAQSNARDIELHFSSRGVNLGEGRRLEDRENCQARQLERGEERRDRLGSVMKALEELQQGNGPFRFDTSQELDHLVANGKAGVVNLEGSRIGEP